jgi:hypothetical protein
VGCARIDTHDLLPSLAQGERGRHAGAGETDDQEWSGRERWARLHRKLEW